MKESLIIKGIQKGDKAVFKMLFKQHFQRMVLYAKSYVQNNQAAEDLAQDIFFTLWEKRREIIIIHSISSYLFRAVHNKCIQYLRHQKVTSEYELLLKLKQKEADLLYRHWNDSDTSLVEFEEIQKIIEKTINSFPDKTKKIFELSRKENLQNKEISLQLGIDIKTVEYHISKALKEFRQALKDFL